MIKLTIPWLEKDALCLQIETLRFIVICYDKDIDEWKTICMFNFDHLEELKETGKKYPLTGMLQGYTKDRQSGFIFLADDTIIV